MGRHKKPDHLAVEAANAKKANMSYGKYKALQYEKGITGTKPTPQEETTFCLYCGKAIGKGKRKGTKYCDWVCGHYYRNELYQKMKKDGAEDGKTE